MDYRKQFLVEPGQRVRLKDVDPGFKDKHVGKSDTVKQTQADDEALHNLQYLLYAEHRRSLLICLQGLDEEIRRKYHAAANRDDT
ncbi:MAG TPA: hypothetical protein VIK27_12195 [Candidatus Aquilonibacter sp.]